MTQQDIADLAKKQEWTVGVFPVPSKKKPRFTAYTVWYSPAWVGCCVHKIQAETGSESKKKAILSHKDLCVGANEARLKA